MSLTSVVRLAVAVLAAALLMSCNGDDSGATRAEERTGAVEGSAATNDGTAQAAAAADSAQPPSESGAELDPWYLHRRAARLLPHDYEIGPLQDLLATGRTEREVLDTLLSFLGSLAEGKIAEAAIASDRRQSLSRSLQFHLRDGRLPHAARIGAVTVTDDQVYVALRLFGEPGRVAGEAYLEATPAGWRIADLQLDLHRLAQPYEVPAAFEPSATRWLLLSP
ncbi:MAG: hypothetical protein OXP69_02545 [Spirochaetaceae bacterium]|nr:hypothetical protein [Spirochaetaceae bacterium]